MAVEPEFSVEVAGSVEEKTGLGIKVNSCQDLLKPDCSVISHGDQANGSGNSSVFENGTNSSGDDTVDNAENVVVLKGSCVESMSAVEFQNGNFDVFNGSLKEGENGKLDSSARAEVEMDGDQKWNFKGVAETEQEKVEDLITETANPATVEKPETQFGKLGLVAESVEKGELNDLSNHSEFEYDNVDDECEDLNNLVSVETSDVCNGSSCLVVRAVENESQEEITEVQSEAPPVTSMDSYLELDPINNKKILGEKEELNNLSSHKNADNTTAECENQINSNETSSVDLGSSDVVVDAVEFGLQEAGTERQSKSNLKGVVVKSPVVKVPIAISVGSGLESYASDKEEKLEENGESENLLSCNNESDDVSDESEDKINVSSSERSGLCEGLQHVVVDAVECEVPLAKPLDSDVELCPINKEGTLEKEAKTTVALDVIENQKQVDDLTSLVSSTDQHVETVDLVSEEKNNAENTVQYPEEPEKHTDISEASPVTMQTENETEDFLSTQSLPTSLVNEPQSELNMSGAETIGLVSSSPANVPKARVIENNASLVPNSVLDTIFCSEKESTFRSGDIQVETEVSSGMGEIVDAPSATVKEKLDPTENHSSFSLTYKKELLDRFNFNEEAASNITWGTSKIRFGTVDFEDMRDQLEGETVISDENLTLKENEDTETSKNGGTSIASSTDEVCEEDEIIKSVTKRLNYLVRVPRFDDESLKEQIKLQEILLDDWTKQRDAIQVLIQETRKANDQSHGVNYENAKNEVSSARKSLRSKRVEIDSLQSMINKAKNAASIQDIDRRICDMEHRIQHESMPLNEEKKLIHEIKQQKQLRKQLSSNMGSQDEIKESLEQKETLEERLKVLRKEIDILKGNVVKAEAAFMEADRKYDGEYKKVKELQARFRAANDSRQEVYDQLKSLRKELKEKNKPFYKYKDDATAAYNYAHSKNSEALHSQCKDQVEKFMELWNNNDKFRKQYVTFNAKSTVRRLGTLDGRALSPNEERPIIPSYVNQKVHKTVSTPAKVDSVSKGPVLELKQEIKLENGISEQKTKKKLTNSKNKASAAKHKEAAEPVLVTGSSKDVPEKVQVEVEAEPTKSKEEIDLERKAEEMRRKGNEAKLKEQLRLEELAKAQEARERKKRKEEKDKRRAELKAQKEAEQKEKEREKRLRKKEKKKNASTEVTAEISNSKDPGPCSETAIDTAQEIEPPKEASISNKKPQRPSVYTKKNKKGVIPPPPQVRRKRNWMQNPWVRRGVLAIILVLLVVYLIKLWGNPFW